MAFLQDIDYSIKGYEKKQTFDTKGDLIEVGYYFEYDEATSEFKDLLVKETRTYTRDVTTGLMTKRDMLIEWFNGVPEVIATKNTVKHFSATQGYTANQRSRHNLINTASMYLLGEVGLVDAKTFLDSCSGEIGTYVGGSIQPLLDDISTSALPFMTAPIKAQLDTILNITY
jgi:hypothetical protein